jgi:transcriptional regulator with XRE-family HTH domain
VSGSERELSAQQVKQLAQRLRDLRQRLHLTQRELSDRAHLSAGLIGSIERHATEVDEGSGRLPNPTLSTMVALVHALELHSLEELLGPLPVTTFGDDLPSRGKERSGEREASTARLDG